MLTKLRGILGILAAVFLACALGSQCNAADVVDQECHRLMSVVQDPVRQRNNGPEVDAAIEELAKAGNRLAASTNRQDKELLNSITGVLIDMISYPRWVKAYKSADLDLKSTQSAEFRGGMRLGKNEDIRAYPVGQALVKVGKTCVPEIIKAIRSGASADLVACLDVLVELIGQKETDALLKRELGLECSSLERDRLDSALVLLPDIHLMPRRMEDSQKGASERAYGVPDQSVTLTLRQFSSYLIIDGTGMVPLDELAKLIHVTVTRYDKKYLLEYDQKRNLGSYILEVGVKNGNASMTLPVAPVLRANKVYVPLRKLAKYYGVEVE